MQFRVVSGGRDDRSSSKCGGVSLDEHSQSISPRALVRPEWIFRDSKGSDPFYRWLQMKQTFIRSGRKTAFSETTNEEKSNLLKTRLYGSLLNCTGTAGGWALPYTSRISAVRVGASDFRYSQSDHGSAPIKIA